MLQGKAKDSGWGSDDEAVSLPAAAAADDEVEPVPANQKPVKKQVASAFDILDQDPDQGDNASAASDVEEPANGGIGELHDDGSDNVDTSSEDEDQVSDRERHSMLYTRNGTKHERSFAVPWIS